MFPDCESSMFVAERGGQVGVNGDSFAFAKSFNLVGVVNTIWSASHSQDTRSGASGLKGRVQSVL